MTIIDISIGLGSNTPTWPESHGFELHWQKRIDAGEQCNNSFIKCDTHIGTHIDAPFHFINEGAKLDRIDLNLLIGESYVVHLPNVKMITGKDLINAEIPKNTKRLLIRTDNSKFWRSGSSNFQYDFTALSPDAAQWIVKSGIRLIGIDYLSIGPFINGEMTHRILLESEVIIVEGLNLYDVASGLYELICLPLKISGADGAPARAILRKK
jgi:arylformamidase